MPSGGGGARGSKPRSKSVPAALPATLYTRPLRAHSCSSCCLQAPPISRCKYRHLGNQAGGVNSGSRRFRLLPRFRNSGEVVEAFKPRQTITDALTEQGLSSELINEIIDAARPEYNLARVRAGRNYWICFTREGIFRDFRYSVDDEHYLTVFHEVGRTAWFPS